MSSQQMPITAQAPQDALPRVLLLGPLRLLRREAETQPKLRRLATFLQKYMADELHTVVERDAIIGHIIYMVSIPMTDHNWKLYNECLARCEQPLKVHEMLAPGRENFDRLSGSPDPDMSPLVQEAHELLKDATAAGMSLEEILAQLVKTPQ